MNDHVANSIGPRNCRLGMLTERANTKRTNIRTKMIAVPNTATRGSTLKPATMATTAATPPTPSAYFTAGTAFIACVKKDAGVTVSVNLLRLEEIR